MKLLPGLKEPDCLWYIKRSLANRFTQSRNPNQWFGESRGEQDGDFQKTPGGYLPVHTSSRPNKANSNIRILLRVSIFVLFFSPFFIIRMLLFSRNSLRSKNKNKWLYSSSVRNMPSFFELSPAMLLCLRGSQCAKSRKMDITP